MPGCSNMAADKECSGSAPDWPRPSCGGHCRRTRSTALRRAPAQRTRRPSQHGADVCPQTGFSRRPEGITSVRSRCPGNRGGSGVYRFSTSRWTSSRVLSVRSRTSVSLFARSSSARQSLPCVQSAQCRASLIRCRTYAGRRKARARSSRPLPTHRPRFTLVGERLPLPSRALAGLVAARWS